MLNNIDNCKWNIKNTKTQKIYYVKELTNLPFQIVITDRLEGEEYAAYRILSDRRNQKYIETIMEQ